MRPVRSSYVPAGVFMPTPTPRVPAPVRTADPYAVLRHRIIMFELLPGELLSEHRLAAQLGTSRTPVRRALDRLAGEGCVEVFPQRGTQVSRISLARLHQAVFLRTALEQEVLRTLCAQGLGGAQAAQVEGCIARQRQYLAARADADLLAEDLAMHRLFFCFCGREPAWATLAALDCDLLRVGFLQLRTYSYQAAPMAALDSWENRLTEHRMLLGALCSRDAAAATLLGEAHLAHVERGAAELRRIYPQYFSGE